VVLTEYPDEPVIRTLQSNVDRNKHLAKCSVHAAGYIWGDEKIDHLV
jgi:nicotinamide N-methyltransferase